MLMVCLMLVLIAAPFNAPQAQAGFLIPLLLTAAAAFAVAVIVDYFSCGFNIFFYCQDKSSGGSGGSSNSETLIVKGKGVVAVPSNTGLKNGAICYSPANICGMRNQGKVAGGVCPATTPADSNCCPSAPNVCGKVNYAQPNAQGTCVGVTVASPSNAICPAPVIGKSFEAKPDLVKKNGTSVLDWNVASATICTLEGGGLSIASLPIVGNKTTNPITQKTIFTLQCWDGIGGPSSSAQATVNLVPSYQEI